MEDLMAQQAILAATVFGLVALVRRTPPWAAHQVVLDAWVPFGTFVLMVVFTLVAVMSRDIDVDTIDVVYFAFLTAGTPTILHEAGKNVPVGGDKL